MRRRTGLLIGLVIVIILFTSTLFFSRTALPQSPRAVEGLLDLSRWSFEENGLAELEGEWSFYFNEFLTYEDFQRGVDTPASYIQLPSTRNSMNAVKPFTENKFYGTLRLVVRLPEHAKAYGLRTGFVLTAFQLYIDGEFHGEVGKVGTSREGSLPYYNILNTYFNPASQEIEIIYHTSDFWIGDCAIAVPKIGLASQVSQKGQLGMGRDLFLFGMLLIMGIYHVGLYLMRRKDRAPIYFGVFCLLFSLRMLLVGERFLLNQLYLHFFIYVRTAYFCVFVGFGALCGFLYHTLDGLFGKWFVQVSLFMGLLFGFLVLFIPIPQADILLIVYALFGFALMGYAFFRMLAGISKNVPFAGIVLFGFAILLATFMNDLVYQITLANTPSMIPLGVAIFTFSQAYTLSARFSNAFTRAEQLSAENEAILSELKHVNSNLESLVGERTADLQKALAEMELMSKTDYLTKLPNRRQMLQKIQKLIGQEKHFYVALADIDHFKGINDRFGHTKGDEVLVRISTILDSAAAAGGFVGRWGGEEFLLVLEADLADGSQEQVLKRANEIRRAVSARSFEEINTKVTITMGLCRHLEATAIESTIAQADKALYQGKLNGRDQCVMA